MTGGLQGLKDFCGVIQLFEQDGSFSWLCNDTLLIHLTPLSTLVGSGVSSAGNQHFGRWGECYLQHLHNISLARGSSGDRLGQDNTNRG